MGLLGLQWRARSAGKKPAKAGQDKRRPIEEKESAKWLRAMRSAREAWRANRWPLAEGRLMHVFDGEGDIREIFEQIAAATDEGGIIRCAQNRRAWV